MPFNLNEMMNEDEDYEDLEMIDNYLSRFGIKP